MQGQPGTIQGQERGQPSRSGKAGYDRSRIPGTATRTSGKPRNKTLIGGQAQDTGHAGEARGGETMRNIPDPNFRARRDGKPPTQKQTVAMITLLLAGYKRQNLPAGSPKRLVCMTRRKNGQQDFHILDANGRSITQGRLLHKLGERIPKTGLEWATFAMKRGIA